MHPHSRTCILFQTGSSSDPCSKAYAGSRSFSEPESRALRDFLLTHKSDMKMYLSFHRLVSTAVVWMSMPLSGWPKEPTNFASIELLNTLRGSGGFWALKTSPELHVHHICMEWNWGGLPFTMALKPIKYGLVDKTCPAGEILQLLELEDGYQLELHNVIYSNYYFTSCVERLAKYLHYFLLWLI